MERARACSWSSRLSSAMRRMGYSVWSCALYWPNASSHWIVDLPKAAYYVLSFLYLLLPLVCESTLSWSSLRCRVSWVINSGEVGGVWVNHQSLMALALTMWFEIEEWRDVFLMSRQGPVFTLACSLTCISLRTAGAGTYTTISPLLCNYPTFWRDSGTLSLDWRGKLGNGCQGFAKSSRWCSPGRDHSKLALSLTSKPLLLQIPIVLLEIGGA